MKLEKILQEYASFSSVLPLRLQSAALHVFDLSSEESPFQQIDFQDLQSVIILTKKILEKHHAILGIGRYAESRNIYRHSKLFSEDQRDFHLGLDLTVPIGTAISTPLAASIHSFQDNQGMGDYGPTIILQHQLQQQVFYTLYGHLSRASLKNLEPGKLLAAGEAFAYIGDARENGAWAPHLHFQIIEDLDGCWGDYPGVCAIQDKQRYLENCPDPNLILRLPI